MNAKRTAADVPHPHAETPFLGRAAHDSKSAILAVLIGRLGGRCVITDDEFAESFARRVRCVRQGGEMILEMEV